MGSAEDYATQIVVAMIYGVPKDSEAVMRPDEFREWVIRSYLEVQEAVCDRMREGESGKPKAGF